VTPQKITSPRNIRFFAQRGIAIASSSISFFKPDDVDVSEVLSAAVDGGCCVAIGIVAAVAVVV
jgi:hypothetical protein